MPFVAANLGEAATATQDQLTNTGTSLSVVLSTIETFTTTWATVFPNPETNAADGALRYWVVLTRDLYHLFGTPFTQNLGGANIGQQMTNAIARFLFCVEQYTIMTLITIPQAVAVLAAWNATIGSL